MWSRRVAWVGAVLLFASAPLSADRTPEREFSRAQSEPVQMSLPVEPVMAAEAPPAPIELSVPTVELVRPDSVSCGAVNRGVLAHAAELPRYGFGYEITEPWWSRDRRYGTAELIDLVERVAATIADQYPGSVLGVGDLSSPTGGPLRGHRSHQTGRDIDLIYYAIDPDGHHYPPDSHMAYYNYKGRATYAKAPEWANPIPERFFDLERNWALVELLLTDPEVEVQLIFVSYRVRRWLLRYARKIGAEPELIARARVALQEPKGAASHSDHMHVRIACSPDDVAIGRCRDHVSSRRARRRPRLMCPRLQVDRH